jgi:hypothetical protein
MVLGTMLSLTATRTVHRIHLDVAPRIVVSSTTDTTKHTLVDYGLRPLPMLHCYDHKHFMAHKLPTGTITAPDTQTTIDTKKLRTLINNLLEEIDHKKTEYTGFKILKNSGFVIHKKCGLLIVKFNDYPFVLKLFIETPESFVNPYNKGFEATNFFIAGGALRHTLGFTRIKTLEYVAQKIKDDPVWKDRIRLPRKWFWLPEHPTWLLIDTYNLGNKKHDHIRMPTTYGVIADELHNDSTQTADYGELMEFSKFVEHRIDPHTKNFFIERGSGKIALIDTELFPSILGFTTRIQPHTSHITWYTHLAGKYLKEKMFTTKDGRIYRQHNLQNYYSMQ